MSETAIMTLHDTATNSLTPEQRLIVDTPAGESTVVLAAAGTGKTHVLVERIRRLLQEDSGAAGHTLLVLSFTRAAVAELRRRVDVGGGGRSRRVRPMTFDSLATRLLAAAGSESPADWRALSHDERVRGATALVEADVDLGLADCSHVFVDEIQDLVGIRATFVRAILARVRAFTVLGDPAQAIFDHQVARADDATSTATFLASIRNDYPAARVHVLERDFRNRTPVRAEVAAIGALLRRDPPAIGDAAAGIASVYRQIEPLSTIDDLPFALAGTRSTAAVLLRSNSDALRVSRLLYGAGIDHRLQRDGRERTLPPWVAALFRDQSRTTWSESRLRSRIDAVSGTVAVPDVDTVWRLLSESVGDDEKIDLDVFRRRWAAGVVADELVAPAPSMAVISTIHRAKGLEFEIVFSARPSGVEDEHDPEELRVLYVALSRASEALWTFPPPAAQLWRRDPALRDRLVRATWRDRSRTLAIELRPDDLESARPAGVGVIEADAQETQDYLAQRVRRGDLLELRLAHVRRAEQTTPIYVALHEGTIVGQTGVAFGEVVARRFRTRSGTACWPTALHGGTCDGLETVAGLASEGEAAGLGSSGLWLRPRLVGIADVDSHDQDEEQL